MKHSSGVEMLGDIGQEQKKGPVTNESRLGGRMHQR